MKNKNMTKKLVDRLVYGGLFALYVILIYMSIDMLIYKQPTLHSLSVVVVSVIITVVVVTIGIFVVIKKYGPYRDKGEKQPPFIAYFAAAFLGQWITRIVMDKAMTIAETTTDTTVGIVKIIALLTMLLVAIISGSWVIENWGVKYSNRNNTKQG